MTPPYQPPRDRDAYAAIRGYVYQVDRTIERLLQLESDQTLELERGEDIDLVGRALASGQPEQETRLLEQIKHRDGNITLRSDEAVESLVNFFDHRTANTQIDLRFCFITNAEVGCEQLNQFPNRTPGITLWESIRVGQIRSDPDVATAALTQFLSTLSRPAGIAQRLWDKWISHLRAVSPNEFAHFVRRFEWCTAAVDAAEYPDAVRDAIRVRGFGRTETEAREVYERLFVHVIRLLSTPGLKRLSPSDLIRVAGETTLAASDRELLQRLEAVAGRHAVRLEVIESRLGELGDQLTQLVLTNVAGATLQPLPPVQDLAVPPPVERLSARSATVDRLNQLLGSACWLALHGGPDSGKSQLIIQLAGRRNCRAWFQISQMDPTAAARAFDELLCRLAGWSAPPNAPGWYTEATAQLEPDTFLVIDDLPRLGEADPLAQRLVAFSRACRGRSVRLLSTSQFVLPTRLPRELGQQLLVEFAAPPFTEVEAKELFQASGAPARIVDGPTIGFLNRLAAGHPLLLVAAIDYLRQREWVYTEAEFTALLQGEHANSLLPEVMARLTRTLADSQRDLLYRLTLPIWSFTTSDVTALAAANPAVARPHEMLSALLGSWVQRTGGERMVVSPLVKPFGKTELSESTRRTCYGALANAIVRHGTMNLSQGEDAILYCVLAGQYEQAGTLYVIMLAAVLRRPKTDYIAEVIGRFWKATDLPQEMSLGCRLVVRGYQLAAYSRHGLDVKHVVRDIDRLLALATDHEGWAIVALAVQAVAHYARRGPRRVMGYITRALALPAINAPYCKELFPKERYLTELLWMVVGQLKTPALLNQWLAAVAAMPEEYHPQFWTSDLARQGVLLVGNSLYLAEYKKSVEGRNWDAVLQALRDARRRAQSLNQPRLEAALTMKILQVQSDLKRLDQLEEDADTTLSRWSTHPDVQFLVRGAWGKQCSYNARHDLARPLLQSALTYQATDVTQERIRILLAASQSFGDTDAASGLRYAEQACDLACLPDDQVPPLLVAQALGERAVSVYMIKQGREGAFDAFAACSAAMKAAFAIRRRDKFWRDMLVMFGSTTGYLTEFARCGHPPGPTSTGEPSAHPIRGNFLTYREDRAAIYQAGNEPSLMWMMSAYAEAVGDDAERRYWLTTAVAAARNSPAAFLSALLGHGQVPDLLQLGRLEDAIDAAVQSGRGLQVIQALRESRPGDVHGIGVDMVEEFHRLKPEQRQQADQNAFILGIVPAFFRIIPMAFDDPIVAAAEGCRVAAMCRQLAEDDFGNATMWRETAVLIEMASVENMNPDLLLQRARELDRSALGDVQVLAYILATWHQSLSDAFHCQLACVKHLHRCYPPGGATHRLLLLPYFESFWHRGIQERRAGFDFTPGIAAEAIEQALCTQAGDRVRAILRAASTGFRVRGLADAMHWLRDTTVV